MNDDAHASRDHFCFEYTRSYVINQRIAKPKLKPSEADNGVTAPAPSPIASPASKVNTGRLALANMIDQMVVAILLRFSAVIVVTIPLFSPVSLLERADKFLKE